MTDKKLTPPPHSAEPYTDTMSLPASGTVSRVDTSNGVVKARGSGSVVIGMSCYKCSVQINPNNTYCPKCGTKISHAGVERDMGAVSRAIEIGALLGDYRIHHLIGEGGMGRVYLAEHTLLGRKVALKRLRSEFSGNREAVKRFFGEARAVNRIAHDNIIEITDFHDSEDGSYYIMELLDGDTLDEVHQRDGVLPLQRVIPIVIQIASALKAVHKAGIVHRDLKPENIFIIEDRDGTDFVKLLDFGVAKLTAEDSTISVNSTQQGAILGTPEYMSPEQASGKNIDERSDIYSFGVILFEMVTGARPFEADNFGEIVVKHLTHPVPSPTAWPGAPYPIPNELEQLIVSCLEKQPYDRLGSMSEIELALRALNESREFDEAATTALGRVQALTDEVPLVDHVPVAVPAKALVPVHTKRPWPLVVAVFAILALGGFLLLRGGADSQADADKAEPAAVAPSDKTAAEKTAADKTAAEETAAEKTAAEKTAAEKTAAEKTAAEKTAAGKTAAGKTAAGKTAPTVTVPKKKARKKHRRHRSRTKRPSKRRLIDKNAVIDPFDE